MIKLKYGNTNTFFIDGLLVDTDYAGTLSVFYTELKKNGIGIKDIKYVTATHYHPDHMGIIGDLVKQGVRLLLLEVQKDFVHFSDYIFERDKLNFTSIDETNAVVIPCESSREFLAGLGIAGTIIHTPSHSEDSVSLVLDNGDCIVGDIEPYEYIEAYPDNQKLKEDWDRLLEYNPRRIFFAHAPALNI